MNYISNRAYIRESAVSRNVLTKIRTTLKYKSFERQLLQTFHQQNEEEGAGVTTRVINEFKRCSKKKGHISIPRNMASKLLPNINFRDATTFPAARIPAPNIQLRSNQKAFFKGLLDAAQQTGPQHILANATTGIGKSVAGIWLGYKLQTPTLIIVDSNKIARGWINNFNKFFGKKWTKKNVGRVQQDSCEYENKLFSIALVQSLSVRSYPLALYRRWGLVIYDEVQIYGNVKYVKVLSAFHSRVLVGLTAENKTGSFGTVIKHHLGQPRVVTKAQNVPVKCRVVRNNIDHLFRAFSDGDLITNLCKQQRRNSRVASIAYNAGYKRGKTCLIFSDRTFQLQELQKRLITLGVPEQEIGLHVGEYQTDNFVVYYKYVGSNKRNRLLVKDTNSQAKAVCNRLQRGDYTDIPKNHALQKALKTGKKATYEIGNLFYKPTEAELDNITDFCSIALVTFAIFAKGADAPRFDMGIAASPEGNATQPIGRVSRAYEGKTIAEWYTLRDKVVLEKATDRQRMQQTAINDFLKHKQNSTKRSLERLNASVEVI